MLHLGNNPCNLQCKTLLLCKHFLYYNRAYAFFKNKFRKPIIACNLLKRSYIKMIKSKNYINSMITKAFYRHAMPSIRQKV